jgi:cytochrome oxidase Cu insertion factor (SCO1/SenC/PrrC family)
MFQVATTADDSFLAICGGVLSDLWAASGSYPWLTAAYLIGPLLLGGLVIWVMDFKPQPGGPLSRLQGGMRRLIYAFGIGEAYAWLKRLWLFRSADRAVIALALVGIVTAGSFLGWKIVTGKTSFPAETAATGVPAVFSLTDHLGRVVTADSFKGQYALVSFGYTFCPDVCPTTLNTLSVTLDMLGDRADTLVTAFITIDPQRDTVKALRTYIANFNPHILGLTGSPENIRTLAKAYRVYYARAAGSDPDGKDYLMEHSAGIYFIDPDGRIVRTFPHTSTPEEIVEAVKATLPAAPIS